MIDEKKLKEKLSEKINDLGRKTQVTDWDYVLCIVYSVINEVQGGE